MTTRTVLIADDEPAISFFMGLVLQSLGFRVVLAYDGQQALTVAGAERPDLVFIDTMLPKLDGRDVTRALRKEAAFRETPIVLFSAAMESDIDWRGAGANAFLAKPFNTLRLRSLVEDLVGKANGQVRAEEKPGPSEEDREQDHRDKEERQRAS